MEQEIIGDYRSQIGEGPIWHPTEKRIYWVDIPEEYRDMYVTSAIAGPGGEDDNEAAGALFRIKTSIRGVPEYCSCLLNVET